MTTSSFRARVTKGSVAISFRHRVMRLLQSFYYPRNDIMKQALREKSLTQTNLLSKGDIVYASAVAGRLETPRVIGEVFKIKEDDYEPLMWDITVKPITDFTMLTHVAVIITTPVKNGK